MSSMLVSVLFLDMLRESGTSLGKFGTNLGKQVSGLAGATAPSGGGVATCTHDGPGASASAVPGHRKCSICSLSPAAAHHEVLHLPGDILLRGSWSCLWGFALQDLCFQSPQLWRGQG